jgi:hypothetical protein
MPPRVFPSEVETTDKVEIATGIVGSVRPGVWWTHEDHRANIVQPAAPSARIDRAA